MNKDITPNHYLSLEDIVGMKVHAGPSYMPGCITIEEIQHIALRAGYKLVHIINPQSVITADYRPDRLRISVGTDGVIYSFKSG